MRFIKLTPAFSEEWDRMVHDSDDSWLYHLYDWLQMTEKIWNLESKSFLVEHQREIIGIFPLQMHKESKILKSIFMGTGGAAIKSSIDPAFRKKIYKAMYEHAEEIAHESVSPYIELYLPPLAKSSLNNRWSINPLVDYFYTDTSTHTWMVDLTKPEDVIFSNLTKDARQSIKKAKEAGYKIKKLESIGEIDKYYEIHCETYHRTGASPFPKDYFQGIYTHACKKGYATIWKGLDQNREPVAFEIIGLFKKGGIYWSGCCKTEHLDSGVNYLLQYNSMLWAKSQGAEWFENGEAFPNIREGKLKGLTVFKGKFGGEPHRFYKGRLILNSEPEKKKVYKDWLQCTALLLQPVLGERIIKFGAGLLQKVYRSSVMIYQFTRSYRRVNFIKPYWGLKEFFSGFFYCDRKKDNSLKILTDKFRQKSNMSGAIIPTSSGRTALELALKVLKNNYPTKHKVITTTYCCRGVFDPIINAGLSPVFADIDKNLSISKDSVSSILKNNEDILAIVVPHMGGCKAEIEEIASTAKEEDIVVIEDVCQALGRKESDFFLGTRYDMSFFSFGMGKNLMASAGGILISNILKEEISKEAKKLGKEDTTSAKRRFLGIIFKYFLKFHRNIDQYISDAYKYTEMHPLDAKIISLQLDKFETILRKRRENAKKIIDALYKTNLKFSLQDDDGNHIYTKLSIIFENPEDRDKLKNNLYKAGIEIEGMYIPLHLREFAVNYSPNQGLPYSEKVYKNVFNIPVRPNLTKKQLNKIIEAILKCKPQKKLNE